MADDKPAERPFTHRWVTRIRHPERHGQLCRLVPKVFRVGFHASGYGSPGFMVTVEFEDGMRVEAPRGFLRSRTTPRPGGAMPPRRR